jgi:hypothetical protein
MKKLFSAMVTCAAIQLMTIQAHGSIICDYPGATTLSVTTSEGVAGNMEQLVVSGSIFKAPVVFSIEAGDQIVVNRKVSESAEETVYLASKPGYFVTVSIPKPIPQAGKSEAIVYASQGEDMIKELLYCQNKS